MSVAECYVINVQCDNPAHGSYVKRDQFTGKTRRATLSYMRHIGWKLGPNFTAYCPECKVPTAGVSASRSEPTPPRGNDGGEHA